MTLMGALAMALLCSAAHAGETAKGKGVYDTRCSFCHGSSGKGDGPAGAALQPRPTNFTDPAFWKTASPEIIKLVIVNGKPGTAMVPFGQTLKPNEIEDVMAYLQTMK
jgi:mono/diheme cytochrome c family protein